MRKFLDRWPGTPMKQFTGWGMMVLFFLFSLITIWSGRDVRMELWYGLAAFVLGYNGDGTLQFFAKRKTFIPPDQQTVTVEGPSTVTVESAVPEVDEMKDEHVERPKFSPGGA